MDLEKCEETVNVSASPSGDDVIRTDEGGDDAAKEGSASGTGTSNNVSHSATVGCQEVGYLPIKSNLQVFDPLRGS
jgi:hypothetical protein